MAAALVGGAFLSASLQVIFDRMASPEFLNLFRGRKQDERILQKLKDTLLTIHVVLDDADNKQFTNPSVKEWLDELQHVVYHADDLVDEIATRGGMQCKAEVEEKSIRTRVLKLMTFSTDTFHKEMESKLENIIARLDYFAKHKDVLGLKEVSGWQFVSNRLPSTSLVDETCVYGRQDEQEKIVKLLVSDDSSANQISVIPIVGMGGIGKTTLAQLVYKDEKVNQYFDKKAWVCVSDPFDVFGITKTILEAVTSLGCDIKDLNQLQVELFQSLKEQKFLFVLDDVWCESYDEWDVLRRPFRSGSRGSKVIVTTRNSNVASMMQNVPFHRAKELSDKDCWSLFSKHAFENGDSSQYPNLEVIGKEIVKKCGGLPLAAKTLGGLLRSKLDAEEWNYIWKSEIWDLPNNKSNIIAALRLSYQYLPSQLKRCFAYCSTFPKDYNFEKEELVLLWMAQNILQQPKSKMTLEEVGDLCFRELLSRSFFQHSLGNESRFVMHDLIHDLAQFVSRESFYRLDNEKQPRDISEKVRHFSYARRFDCHYISEKVRHFSYTIFCNFVGLLQQCLSSLRSLVISDIPNLAELPPELSLITNLEELVIQKCGRLESFSDMVLPSGLRTLTVDECDAMKSLPEGLTCLQELAISKCSSLVSFPSGGLPTALENLRIRCCGKLELPLEMDHCNTSIKSLWLYDSCDSLKSFPLSFCPNIFSIHIVGCRNFETLLSPNRLENLIQLRYVTIKSCPNVVSFPVGGFPAPDLQSFSIWKCKNLKSLPSFFPSLQELDIEDCPELECLAEGCLPSNLQRLHIRNCEKLMARRKDWGLQILPSLTYFEIRGEYEEEDAWKTFPEEWLLPSSLSELYVWGCPNLKALNHKGFQRLGSLRTLHIWKCRRLESLSEEVLPSSITELMVGRCRLLKPRLEKEKGYDWPKIAHIPFIMLDGEVF